jgi:hypothetical protein
MVGTFVGEISATETTRDKHRCTVKSEARVTLNVASHGLAKWIGYHRFEMVCKGENAPPLSCWDEGIARVSAADDKTLAIETLTTTKIAGPVQASSDTWKCGRVVVAVPPGT